MSDESRTDCTAFEGHRRIASGSLSEVASAAKRRTLAQVTDLPILVFDPDCHAVELDLRGTLDEVERRYARAPTGMPEGEPAPGERRGPGRPKLGVVGREVTLLPRHWAWLGDQRGGASATLRRLVDQARRATADEDRIRRRQDATYRFLLAMVGNEPGFEEATRALYAGDTDRFGAEAARWPTDLRDHALSLAQGASPGSVRDEPVDTGQ